MDVHQRQHAERPLVAEVRLSAVVVAQVVAEQHEPTASPATEPPTASGHPAALGQPAAALRLAQRQHQVVGATLDRHLERVQLDADVQLLEPAAG